MTESATGEPTIRLEFEAIDTGDFEDIAEYAGRDDVYGLIYAAFQAAYKAKPGEQLPALYAALPPKVVSGLFGCAKRHVDPDWTPEHWRKFRLSDLVPTDTAEGGLDPTSAGSTPGSTSAAPRNGKRTRKPKPSVVPNGSVSTRP